MDRTPRRCLTTLHRTLQIDGTKAELAVCHVSGATYRYLGKSPVIRRVSESIQTATEVLRLLATQLVFLIAQAVHTISKLDLCARDS